MTNFSKQIEIFMESDCRYWHIAQTPLLAHKWKR
jgi:hypothetical protein